MIALETLAGLPELATDVLIVGAGPAGLATAIRIKQLAPDASVTLVDKGAEIGAHILSGAVLDPSSLDRLLPHWRERDGLATPVSQDRMRFYTKGFVRDIPHALVPPPLRNDGHLIVSLGALCRWLGEEAQALGVDIYPGVSGASLVQDKGVIVGVHAGEQGLNRDGTPGPQHDPGMLLRARYTVLAEGARGSLTKKAIAAFDLANASQPQKYGLGLKEIWRVPADRHHPGRVEHGLGWPLGGAAGGGSFVYHYGEGLVSVGLVVHLDHGDPTLSPFEEFQQFKRHPAIQSLLSGAQRLSFGARAIVEGGWQSVPRLCFPGGVLAGDAAGFVNMARIKGIHNAIASGTLAAEYLVPALRDGRQGDELTDYDAAWRSGPIGKDLWAARNAKPMWSRLGWAGLMLAGAEQWLNALVGRSPFGTWAHKGADHAALRPIAGLSPRTYPRPDGVVTFDRTSSIYLSGTNHADTQPVHLKLRDPELQRDELDRFGGPSALYCPAGVYEWLTIEGSPRLQINAQNCIHCKTCDILDPNQNIDWQPPEGGGGPSYVDG